MNIRISKIWQLSVFASLWLMVDCMGVATLGSLSVEQALGIAQHNPNAAVVLNAAGFNNLSGLSSDVVQALNTNLLNAFNNQYSSMRHVAMNSTQLQQLWQNYVSAANQAETAVNNLGPNPNASAVQAAINLVDNAGNSAAILMATVFLNIDKGFLLDSAEKWTDPFTNQQMVVSALPNDETLDQYVVNFFVSSFSAIGNLLTQLYEMLGGNSSGQSTQTTLQIAAQTLGLQPQTSQAMQSIIQQAGCQNQPDLTSQIYCATNYAITHGLTYQTTPTVSNGKSLNSVQVAALVTGLIAFISLGAAGLKLWRAGKWPFSSNSAETLQQKVQRIGEEIDGTRNIDTDLLGKLSPAARDALDPSQALSDLAEVFGEATSALAGTTEYTFLDDIEDVATTIINDDVAAQVPDAEVAQEYQKMQEQMNGDLGQKISSTDDLLESAIPAGSDLDTFDILNLAYELPSIFTSGTLEANSEMIKLVGDTLQKLSTQGHSLDQFKADEISPNSSAADLFKTTATKVYNSSVTISTGAGVEAEDDIGAQSGTVFKELEGLDGLDLAARILQNAQQIGRTAFEQQLQELRQNLADEIEKEGADSADAKRLQAEYDAADSINTNDIPEIEV